MTSYADQQDGHLPSGLDSAGQAWFAAIVDSSADAVIGLTPDAAIASWNAAAARLYGHSVGEAIGRDVALVLPPDRTEEIRSMLDGLRPGAPAVSIETVHIRKEGRPIEVSVTASPVTTAAGKALGAVLTVRETTPGRRAMQEAEERRNRVEAELSSALAAKEDLIQQKDVLLKEVNHRVKNSLQLVSSLLNLQSLSIDDPKVRQQFSEACTRIAMVAAVHERLYRTGKVQTVEFGPYLHQMCGDVASAATYGRSRRVVVETADLDIETDRAIPLALIVNELLTNALKYAYPDGRDGEVRVISRIDGDGRLRVCVADDGVGFPDGFDPTTSDTLGMKLIRALAAQLDGELTIPRDGPGACVELCIRSGPDR